MIDLSKIVTTVILLLICAGCGGGYYILTTPDQVGPLGEDAPVVVRLQIRDFWMVRSPAKDRPMRFRVRGGPERIAHTDENGYAGDFVPIPDRPGRYLMTVSLTDTEGEQVNGLANLYVFDPSLPVVVVDADALPVGSVGVAAVAAVNKIRADNINIAYLTSRQPDDHYLVHDMLRAGGYPPGPLLMWQRQRYRTEPWRFKLKKLIVEKRMVSQLAEMREIFPLMKYGICDSTLAAEAFVDADLQAVIIGNARAPSIGQFRRTTWAELTRGLP